MTSSPAKATTTERPVLWVVSELYYPEETSTGYYMTRIAEGLTDEFTVKALCGQPNYFRRGLRAPAHEVHNGVEIFRTRSTTFDKNVIPLRVINMVTLALTMLWVALRRFQKGDRVLVVTTPPLLPFIAAIASLFRGAAFTLLIHDNYPEMVVAVGKTKRDSLFTRTVNFFNRWLYKHATRIIVVGRDMQELVEKKTEGLNIPIVYIPNWAELETVRPLPKHETRLLLEYGLREKFVVLYAGNMGRPNDLESIVAAAELLQRDPEMHFVFLGSGAKRKWLERTVSELELPNVTILEPRPRSDQLDFLNACNLGVVSLVNEMKGVSMPSRTYNILAAGKPILAIAEKGSEIDHVLQDDNVGVRVPPGEPELLADAISQLRKNSNELAEMGQNARQAALERYSLHAALNSYRKYLK